MRSKIRAKFKHVFLMIKRIFGWATPDALNEVNREERAIEFYRQTLLHNPDFPPALNNLAYLYADSPQHGEEARVLQRRDHGVDVDLEGEVRLVVESVRRWERPERQSR